MSINEAFNESHARRAAEEIIEKERLARRRAEEAVEKERLAHGGVRMGVDAAGIGSTVSPNKFCFDPAEALRGQANILIERAVHVQVLAKIIDGAIKMGTDPTLVEKMYWTILSGLSKV